MNVDMYSRMHILKVMYDRLSAVIDVRHLGITIFSPVACQDGLYCIVTIRSSIPIIDLINFSIRLLSKVYHLVGRRRTTVPETAARTVR
jgi:hypothetical protein